MPRFRSVARSICSLVLVVAVSSSEGAGAQLPSPAADVAEAFLEIVRSGDEARLRTFYETRLTPDLLGVVPMEQHLAMGAMFRQDLVGREIAGVELRGPHEVSIILEGPEDRLELRIGVKPEPPHRIETLRVSDAGPELVANSVADLDAGLRRLANRDEFSGVVLVAASGEVRFHEAYGLADRAAGRRNELTTRFDIGSLGKLFTATAVLSLVEDGRLEFSDAVGEYLEGLESTKATEVTIHQLLAHRSGFGDYLDHRQFRSNPKVFDEPADFLPLAREQGLAFEPGTGERYSNLGYVLLGAILEEVTGLPYGRVVDELVFRPAGMASAGLTSGSVAARRYHSLEREFVAVDSIYPDVASPAGGAFAAATDLHRFMDALYSYELMSEQNTRLLLNGFNVEADPGLLPDRFGFAGGARGVAAVVQGRPAEGHHVIILANLDSVSLAPLARRILELPR